MIILQAPAEEDFDALMGCTKWRAPLLYLQAGLCCLFSLICTTPVSS